MKHVGMWIVDVYRVKLPCYKVEPSVPRDTFKLLFPIKLKPMEACRTRTMHRVRFLIAL